MAACLGTILLALGYSRRQLATPIFVASLQPAKNCFRLLIFAHL
jgi:hypothetical protein